jgi:hypothetical protein
MSDPGPAQLDLIRRYARTLREIHADAMRIRSTDRADRLDRTRAPSAPIRQAAKKAMGNGSADSGHPTLPAS